MTKTATKREQALEIVAANAGKARKDVIEILREKLGMSEAGASTYYYNAQQDLKKADKKQVTNEALSGALENRASAKKGATKKKSGNSKTDTSTAPDGPTEKSGGSRTNFPSNWAEEQRAREQQLMEVFGRVKVDLDEIPDFLKKGKV